jgi:DNA-binding transcriptional regulator YbjK
MFKTKINKTLALFISLLILLSGSIAVLASSLTEVHASEPQVLGVSISPSGPVKLSVGQVQVFTASCSNVSFAPFSYEWSANGSVLGTGQTLSFSFSAACSGELIVLRVTGKDGSLGCATKWVSDPAYLPAVNIDALPIGAIASTDGLGWYYYTFNGQLMDQSTNAAQIIDEALGNYSSVTVQNGTWNANLGRLPANVILKINGGVTGLTYIPSAGDYVIDESSGVLWWNGVNDTYLLSNPYSSLITNATIIALIASSTLNWAQISDANATADQLIMAALASVTNLKSSQISDFKSAVDNLLSYASISTSQITGFNGAVNSLIAAASIAWSQVANANETVVQLVTNSAITWSQITNANLTVQQLVGIYQNFNWQGSWNATVQQIIGNAAVEWNQVTGANATVNALISEASLSWSQIPDANTKVNSLISTYMSTLSSLSVSGTITAENVVSTEPIGAYSYMIYIDPATGHYAAKAANGTICWSSTNCSSVFTSVALAAAGKSVHIDAGNYYPDHTTDWFTGTQVTGDGCGTVISANFLGLFPIFEVPAYNYGVEVSSLTFNGTGGVDGMNPYGWHGCATSHNNWVHNCWFENFTTTTGGAIDPSNSYNNIIENNICINDHVGIFLTGTATQFGNIISGNQINNCNIGIESEFPYQDQIINNQITQFTTYGISIDGSYQSIGENLIAGNTIISSQSTAAAGILLGSGSATWGYNQNEQILNNIISLSGANGQIGLQVSSLCSSLQIQGGSITVTGSSSIPILLSSGSNSVISGVTMQDPTGGDSVYIVGSVQQLKITQCTITSRQVPEDYGINFAAGTSGGNITISDNTFYGYGAITWGSSGWSVIAIEDNTFYGQVNAIWSYSPFNVTVNTVFVAVNNFINCTNPVEGTFTNLTAQSNWNLADSG